MDQTARLLPYFEHSETSSDDFSADSYIAGLREATGVGVVQVTLPAEVVDLAVLSGLGLSIQLTPDGRLLIDGDGLDDKTFEATQAAGSRNGQTLESLIEACLNLEVLAGEDDPIRDLTALRAQLVRALATLDGTLDRLKSQ